jgi:hypothetical protein
MRRIESDLPDAFSTLVADLSADEMDALLGRAERMRQINERHDEAKLRKVVAWYLLGAGTVILATSLALIVMTALGRARLGEAALSTLIGSVAVEFVGMLYLVVRYLFREER